MPLNHTPDRYNADWTETIDTIADGEDVEEGILLLPHQRTADRLETFRELGEYLIDYEGDSIPVGGNAYGQLAAVATKALTLLDGTMVPLSSTNIEFYRGGFKFKTVTTGTSEAHTVVIRVPSLPQFYGRTITSAGLIVTPAGGHAALPTEQPCATLRRTRQQDTASLRSADGANASTWQSLGSPDVGTYNLGGAFSLGFACDQNNVYDPGSYAYEFLIRNEAGTNGLAGLLVAAFNLLFDPV